MEGERERAGKAGGGEGRVDLCIDKYTVSLLIAGLHIQIQILCINATAPCT